MFLLRDGRRIAGVTDEEVREALGTFQFYGGESGPQPEDAMAHAIACVDELRSRRAAEERQHERRRDSLLRFAEAARELEHKVAIHLARSRG